MCHTQINPTYSFFFSLIDIVDCVPGVCLNGAVCAESVNTYTCQCAAGFTGSHCETSTHVYIMGISILICIYVI